MEDAMQDISEDLKTIPPYIEQKFINRSTGNVTFEDEPGALMEYFVNEEMTPEYALMRELYPFIDDISAEPFDSQQEPNLVELEGGPTLDIDPMLEEPAPIDPSLRIIEDDEDTEGLF